jgi:hypothetical protein
MRIFPHDITLLPSEASAKGWAGRAPKPRGVRWLSLLPNASSLCSLAGSALLTIEHTSCRCMHATAFLNACRLHAAGLWPVCSALQRLSLSQALTTPTHSAALMRLAAHARFSFVFAGKREPSTASQLGISQERTITTLFAGPTHMEGDSTPFSVPRDTGGNESTQASLATLNTLLSLCSFNGEHCVTTHRHGANTRKSQCQCRRSFPPVSLGVNSGVLSPSVCVGPAHSVVIVLSWEIPVGRRCLARVCLRA